jgi:hypothetical protein
MTQSDLAFLKSACNLVILNLCVGAKSNIGPLSPACARFDVYLIDAKIMPYSDLHVAKAEYPEVNYSFSLEEVAAGIVTADRLFEECYMSLGYSC